MRRAIQSPPPSVPDSAYRVRSAIAGSSIWPTSVPDSAYRVRRAIADGSMAYVHTGQRVASGKSLANRRAHTLGNDVEVLS
eukprot:2519221-Rhodomonas_salina.2